MTEIHLHHPEVTVRERRLGAIRHYEGSAKFFQKELSKGGFVERERTFTQCTSCSSVTALCQLCMIRDAAVVNHAPIGCAGDFPGFNMIYRHGSFRRGFGKKNLRLISTNLTEREIVYGGTDKLEAALRAAKERFSPKAIFVTTSCAAGIIADDVEGLCTSLEEELGLPLVPIFCDGFRSNIWASGFDAAYHGILRRIVKPSSGVRTRKVNIVNFWGSDTFGQLFRRLDLEPQYITPFSTIAELESVSDALATVQMCSTLGGYLAAGLEQNFGVQEIKTPPPYGIPATDAWLRAIGVLADREAEAELLITEEKGAVMEQIQGLRSSLAGKRAFIAAGHVHSHALACVLRELGMELVGVCAYHHDRQEDHGESSADSLAHTAGSYGDFPYRVCDKQSYEVVKLLKKIRPDIFVARHHGMAVWGAKSGIPTFLMGDEHFGLGYAGIVRYGGKIADAIRNPSFVENLTAHTALPYRQAWLNTPDISLLRRETP